MRLYLRALSYYRHEWLKVLLLLALIVLSTAFGLLQAWPLAVLADSVLMGTQRHDWIHQLLLAPLPANTFGQILGLTGMTLLFRVGQEVTKFLHTLLGHEINYSGLMRIRRDLYRKVQSLSMAYHSTRAQGDTIYRLSYDTYGCLIILNTFITVALAVVTLGAMAAILWSRNHELTLIALAVAPLLMMTHRSFGRWMDRATAEGKRKDSDLLSTIQQSVTSIPLAQAFNREACEFNRFEQAAHANIRAWVRMHWSEVAYGLAIGTILASGAAAIFGYGGYLVYRDQFVRHAVNGMTIGDLMIVLAYLAQLYDPLSKLSGAGATVMQGLSAAQRLFEVLDEEPVVKEASDAMVLSRHPRTLRLEGLMFGYAPDRPVLKGIDATIRPGEMVAFVGPSGAGKSTLLNLLPRYYDPTEGAVTLDHHDLRSIRLQDLRKHIALVPQDSLVLPTTIAENIAYGRPNATEAEIREAAALAGADSFIEALPCGYHTRLEEGGRNLSGGQRQRLAIARALLTRAPILILDEPTSSLDAEHESHVNDTLARLKGQRTVILVSHRLTSVVQCDRIYMMEDGHIVEEGKHAELLARKGRYYAMAKHQVGVDLHGRPRETPDTGRGRLKVVIPHTDPFPLEIAQKAYC